MLDPTKYDDGDWHEGAAYEAGYSRAQAFTHIGLYVAWVIRHDMHAPEFWPEDHIAGVRAGTMTGSDLAEAPRAALDLGVSLPLRPPGSVRSR